MKHTWLLFTFLTAFSFCSLGQGTPKWTVDNLKFISGKWVGSTQWGEMEEYWSQPMGNTMMCSYMCVNKGKVVFYEFIVIENGDSVPVMKLRHFNPGSIAWEDKENPNLYPLIKLETNLALFESPDKKTKMTFKRIDAKHLKIILDTEEKNGKWESEVFEYALSEK